MEKDTEVTSCRRDMQVEISNLATRVAVVESNQKFFKETVLAQLVATGESEKTVSNKLDRMTRALSSVPKEIATQVSECQAEMLEHLEGDYAKKSEVVTAASLRTTLLLVAALVTLLGTGINWLLEDMVIKHRVELNRERGFSQEYHPSSQGEWYGQGPI